MESTHKTLPFYFREIKSINKVLLSNQAGSFSYLDNYNQLEEIVESNYSNINSSKLDELTAKSFVGEVDDYDIRVNLIASKYASSLQRGIESPSLFLVVPTLRCDHDCSYCQVSRVPVSRSGYDLEVDKIQKIIEVIDRVSSSSLKIEFQGGEPLLAFDFIQRFVELAEKSLSGKDVTFVICTALGPLNDEVLSWSKDHNIYISTSLDGSEIIHNKNRPSKFFNPYNNVVSNINRIRKEIGKDKVSCLATVTRESLSDPRGMIETYYEMGMDTIFLRPLSYFGFAYHKIKRIGYSVDEFFKFYKLSLDKIISLNKERYFVEENALIHLKKIFRFGETSFVDLKSPSGYVLGALVFNYDGNIFGSDEARMLWETTKSPELILGNINDAPEDIFSNPYAKSLISDTFLSTTPGCDECVYQPFCGADPLYHLSSQGDHIGNKALSEFCKFERMMFDYIFELYESNSSANKVFKEWLNH